MKNEFSLNLSLPKFLEMMSSKYEGHLGAARVSCLYQVKVCEAIHRFVNGWDKVGVIGVNDPAYRWVEDAVGLAVLPETIPSFSLGLTPGCDQSDLLLLLAEAIQDCAPMEWMVSQRTVDREILKGADLTTRLRREVWSALTVLATEITDPEGGAPVVVCSQGENLTEAGLYEMQDLTLRHGLRFIILMATDEPETVSSQFVNGSGKHIATFQHLSCPDLGFTAHQWHEVNQDLAFLVSQALSAGEWPAFIWEGLKSALEAEMDIGLDVGMGGTVQ